MVCITLKRLIGTTTATPVTATEQRGKLWQLLKPHVHEPLYLDENDEKVVLLSREQVRAAVQALERH